MKITKEITKIGETLIRIRDDDQNAVAEAEKVYWEEGYITLMHIDSRYGWEAVLSKESEAFKFSPIFA